MEHINVCVVGLNNLTIIKGGGKMADACGDNRFEIIAKVKEHLLKATNIEMHPEELAQLDNILFRLWQLNYFNQCI